MKEIIKLLDIDINKCDESLKTNNLLEMAISIEEMIDKYKNNISNLSKLEKNNVWSYNKKDLEVIKLQLETYKSDIVVKHNKTIIEESFNEAIESIKRNNILSNDKKNEVLHIIQDINNIIESDFTTEEKWEKTRGYISYISKENFDIGYILINLISFSLKSTIE